MYQQLIREILARDGQVGRYNPRHIEGWMRLERGCLDDLSTTQFTAEVRIAAHCVAAATFAESESLAKSEGL